MDIYNFEQRSEEWFAIRCGVPTASNFDKIITADGKPSKQREKYLWKLAGEKLSGKSEETYQSQAMLLGIEKEAEARNAYGFITGQEVVEVGFCLAEGFGCSPDGFVGDLGLLEIKCPLVSTQVSYILDNKLPSEYFQQVQGQLLVTGRKWLDFMSYYPGLKPLIIRVEPDVKFLSALKSELKGFCRELEEVIKKVK